MDIETFLIKTADHLMNQTKICTNAEGGCVYAGPDGNACAIGCHFPRELAEEIDRVNKSKTHGGSWRTIKGRVETYGRDAPSAFHKAAGILNAIPVDLAQAVQLVHDNNQYRNLSDKLLMVRNLLQLGHQYGASKPCLDALQSRVDSLVQMGMGDQT